MARPSKRKEIAHEALRMHLLGEQQAALHNLLVYFENPAGIGEHPELQEEMRQQLDKVANAEDALETLERHKDLLLGME